MLRFGFGEVLHAGRLDTETLIKSYKNFFEENKFIEETFEYDIFNFKITYSI